MNTWGGKRKGSGRLPARADLATEKMRLSYRQKFSLLTNEEIDYKIKENAKRLGRPDICEYMENPDSYNVNHVYKRQNYYHRKAIQWNLEEAIRLREYGMTYKDIAHEVGAPSLEAVYEALKGHNNKKEFNYKRAVELREKGLSYSEIGAIFKLSSTTIQSRLNNEETTYDPELILEKGKIYIAKYNRSIRKTISYRGKTFIYARVIWDSYNPEDMLQEGELIHHIDENTMNDDIYNLKKVTLREHRALHKQS